MTRESDVLFLLCSTALSGISMNSKYEPAHTRTDLGRKVKTNQGEKLTINIRGCIRLLYLNVLCNFLTDFYFFVQLNRKQTQKYVTVGRHINCNLSEQIFFLITGRRNGL